MSTQDSVFVAIPTILILWFLGGYAWREALKGRRPNTGRPDSGSRPSDYDERGRKHFFLFIASVVLSILLAIFVAVVAAVNKG